MDGMGFGSFSNMTLLGEPNRFTRLGRVEFRLDMNNFSRELGEPKGKLWWCWCKDEDDTI